MTCMKDLEREIYLWFLVPKFSQFILICGL